MKNKYQERVFKEADELQNKIYALEDFIRSNAIFGKLDILDRGLLESQHLLMIQYATILRQRIARFK